MTEDYRVQLDVFTGPLDLLLYLIRRDELDIQDIPLARLTEQYLEYVRLLEQLDPNSAGDFLVMASTLVELKSRALLPTPPLESEDDDDPRTMLVKQLLEYKRFKDAAAALGSSADDRSKRYARVPADLPKDLEGVELEEAQVWDLLSAFGRVMSAIGQGPGFHQVVYSDTPIEEYKIYLLDALEQRGTMKFRSLFDSYSTKAEMIGMFLAILELIRNRRLRAEQDTLHGEIYLFRQEEVPSSAIEEEEAEPEELGASALAAPDESAAPRLVPQTDENPDLADEDRVLENEDPALSDESFYENPSSPAPDDDPIVAEDASLETFDADRLDNSPSAILDDDAEAEAAVADESAAAAPDWTAASSAAEPSADPPSEPTPPASANTQTDTPIITETNDEQAQPTLERNGN